MVAFLAMHSGGAQAIGAYDLWAAEAMADLKMGNGTAYVNFLAEEGARVSARPTPKQPSPGCGRSSASTIPRTCSG